MAEDDTDGRRVSARARTPGEVAARYAELFNAGRYAEMGALFAPDAVWRRLPPDPEVRGGELIAAGYASAEQQLRFTPMRITSQRYVVDGSTVAAEFVFSGNGHSSHVVDLFEIDEQGRVAAMTVFAH